VGKLPLLRLSCLSYGIGGKPNAKLVTREIYEKKNAGGRSHMKAISFASQFRRNLLIHLFTRRDRSAFICPNLHASNLVTFFGPVPAPNLYVLLGRTVVRKSLQRHP